MPTYVIDGNAEVSIGAETLTAQLGSIGGGNAFRLQIVANDKDVAGSITPRPGMVVLPRLTERAAVRVYPVGATVFPDATIVSLTLDADSRGSADPERIVLTQLDVSGLTHRDLVILEPRDGRIFARSSFLAVDYALGELAVQSRVATRGVLGVEGVDPTSAINLVLAIDGSASMLRRSRDGSVGALLEVFLGISQVVSPDRSVRAALVTDEVVWATPDSLSALGAAVSELQERTPLASGIRLAHPGLLSTSPDENTVTFLITDAVPPDHCGLAEADSIEGEARHLVVLSDRAAFDLQERPDVTYSVVEPLAGAGELERRLRLDPMALRALIVSLLQGCFVPGTDYAKRVAS